MKAIKKFFPSLFAIILAMCCVTAISAQAQQTFTEKVKKAGVFKAEQPIMKVAIKVYLCPGATRATMRAINPDAHSFSHYDEDIYSVFWTRNGLPYTGGVQIDCVSKGNYSVMVTNVITGRHARASIAFFPRLEYQDENPTDH